MDILFLVNQYFLRVAEANPDCKAAISAPMSF
jgi:hypothetical protein